jgi:hypothetical protein
MPTLGVRPRDDQLRQRGYLVLVEGEYPSFYKILGRLIRVHRVLLTVQRGKCSASHPIWKEMGIHKGREADGARVERFSSEIGIPASPPEYAKPQ